VERGAALLDAKQPGWAPRIDLPTLDMGDCDHCVLGQVYRYYWIGVEKLGLNLGLHEEISHGFAQSQENVYPHLLPLWHEAIEARCGRER